MKAAFSFQQCPPPTALPDTHFHLQCGLQTPLTEGLPQDTVWSQTLWSWLCSTERRRGTQEPPLPHQSWPPSCPYEHSEEFSLARFSFPVLNFSVWVPTLKHGYVKKKCWKFLVDISFPSWSYQQKARKYQRMCEEGSCQHSTQTWRSTKWWGYSSSGSRANLGNMLFRRRRKILPALSFTF